MLVFGEHPRVPGELLSDDHAGLLAADDAYQDPTGVDEASKEFRRRHEIRDRARQAAMEQSSAATPVEVFSRSSVRRCLQRWSGER